MRSHLQVAVPALSIVLAGCPLESAPCGGHDGGDGSCVDVGECAEGFTIDGDGRCSRWRRVGSLPFLSNGGTIHLLEDGRVLVAGGNNEDGQTSRSATFDPATEEWRENDGMSFARSFHTGVVVGDGRVFVMGGGGDGASPREIEVFDPEAETWELSASLPGSGLINGSFLDNRGRIHLVTGADIDVLIDPGDPSALTNISAPAQPRILGSVLSLPDGGAVVLGGQTVDPQTNSFFFPESAHRFDPVSETWRELAAHPLLARDFFASAVTGNYVFAAGGADGGTEDDFIATAVFLDWTTGEVEEAPELPSERDFIRAVPHEGGVIVIGGSDGEEAFADVRLYRRGSVTDLPSLPAARTAAYAIALGDGRVLVTGGLAAERDDATSTLILERGE